MAQGDAFATQDTPDAVGIDDLRKIQVGRALVYVGRPGNRPFPDGTIVRPLAENPHGQQIWVRSDADGSRGLAHADELTVPVEQQVTKG